MRLGSWSTLPPSSASVPGSETLWNRRTNGSVLKHSWDRVRTGLRDRNCTGPIPTPTLPCLWMSLLCQVCSWMVFLYTQDQNGALSPSYAKDFQEHRQNNAQGWDIVRFTKADSFQTPLNEKEKTKWKVIYFPGMGGFSHLKWQQELLSAPGWFLFLLL